MGNLTKYHAIWFDPREYRTRSFFVVAESVEQVKDWVFEQYNPHIHRDMVTVEVRQGGLKLPIIVEG